MPIACTRGSVRCAVLTASVAALALAPACAERAARGRGEGAAAPTPEPQVRLVGRVTLDAFDPDAIRFGWQGSGLVGTVRGSRIAARLASDDGREIFFHLMVDGKPYPRFAVSSRTGQEVTLADGLGPGAHAVELYRDTESHQGASRFQGVTQGVVEDAPPSSGRLLEIIGDSISTGYGDLGHETHSPQGDAGECTWTASTSSWAQSYGALAGHAVGAEVSTIAMSGAPQAVVVQIGGNDLGPREKPTFDRQLFVQAGLDLVAQIRAHAPDTWIFFALGLGMDEPGLAMLREAHQAIVDQRRSGGDQRIERIELPTAPRTLDGAIVTGCQWHPSLADHQRMAEVLRQRLHQRLGW